MLRDALYEVMQRTRDETPEGAEFTNSGDWEQWTEVILSDPAFREALVEAVDARAAAHFFAVNFGLSAGLSYEQTMGLEAGLTHAFGAIVDRLTGPQEPEA